MLRLVLSDRALAVQQRRNKQHRARLNAKLTDFFLAERRHQSVKFSEMVAEAGFGGSHAISLKLQDQQLTKQLNEITGICQLHSIPIR